MNVVDSQKNNFNKKSFKEIYENVNYIHDNIVKYFNDINKIPNANVNENQILESEEVKMKNEFSGKVKIDL